MSEINPKWLALYHAVNKLMLEMSLEGTISTRDSQTEDVMDALYDIDEGVYDEKRINTC